MQHRDEWQVRGQGLELEEVGHGPALVLDDGQPRLGDDGWFAHPVLRRRPHQAADGVVVAPDPVGTLAGLTPPISRDRRVGPLRAGDPECRYVAAVPISDFGTYSTQTVGVGRCFPWSGGHAKINHGCDSAGRSRGFR